MMVIKCVGARVSARGQGGRGGANGGAGGGSVAAQLLMYGPKKRLFCPHSLFVHISLVQSTDGSAGGGSVAAGGGGRKG